MNDNNKLRYQLLNTKKKIIVVNKNICVKNE